MCSGVFWVLVWSMDWGPEQWRPLKGLAHPSFSSQEKSGCEEAGETVCRSQLLLKADLGNGVEEVMDEPSLWVFRFSMLNKLLLPPPR